jgi:hypothetical protein
MPAKFPCSPQNFVVPPFWTIPALMSIKPGSRTSYCSPAEPAPSRPVPVATGSIRPRACMA